MPITEKNIVRHELIGLEAEIVQSKDSKKEKLKGKIIDETKKMLLFRTVKGEKMAEKATSILRITLPDGKKADIDGMLLLGRPEERIKKKFPKKWDVIDNAKKNRK